MALVCGNNSMTYRPTGDGLDKNPGIAVALAVADYQKSYARILKKLQAWDAANPNCPAGCPNRSQLTLEAANAKFTLKFVPPLGKWGATIGHDLTGVVDCSKPGAGAGGGGKKKQSKGQPR